MAACSERWNELLSADLDGELAAAERTSLAGHLRTCAPCSAVRSEYQAIRARLTPAKSVTVPPELTTRIRSLARSAPRRTGRTAFIAAASALAVAAAATFVSWPGGLNAALADDLERHHLKAFSRASPCEFESGDPAAVQDWLARELGQSVRVPAISGATLLGARRCHLAGERVGAVLYRHGEQAVTLFVAPPGSQAARLAARFAEDGPRCTSGRIGERICIAPGETSTVLAVAEQEGVALAALTATLQ